MSKYRKGRCLRKVDTAKLHKRLFTILSRDTDKLMTAGFERQLTKDEAGTIVNYLKLLKELNKVEDTSKYTDEQLAALAKE